MSVLRSHRCTQKEATLKHVAENPGNGDKEVKPVISRRYSLVNYQLGVVDITVSGE